MSNTSFYKAYFKHSLAVDWMLANPSGKPQVQPSESSTPYIFVAPKSLKGSSVEGMMERMIIAIKQTPQTVEKLFVDQEGDWKEHLQQMLSAKKVMVFGESLQQGSLGEWKKEGSHSFMVTNDLLAIKKQPSLKKQTWQHLQSFVGLK